MSLFLKIIFYHPMLDLMFFALLKYIKSLRLNILQDIFDLLWNCGGYDNCFHDFLKFLETEWRQYVLNHCETIETYIYLREHIKYFDGKYVFDWNILIKFYKVLAFLKYPLLLRDQKFLHIYIYILNKY